MRELDECTAEVFRRSEKRIRERRKKRIRILAVCIPVCLVAAAWSAMGLPAVMPGRETSDKAQMVGEPDGSFVCPYTAVEIQDNGLFPAEHSGKVTQQEAVTEMFRAIHSLFADTDGNDRNAGENILASDVSPAGADYANHDQFESASKWRGWTIIFTAEDGSQAVYYLSGDTLVDAGTNETIFLSGAQAAGLTAVLGVSD